MAKKVKKSTVSKVKSIKETPVVEEKDEKISDTVLTNDASNVTNSVVEEDKVEIVKEPLEEDSNVTKLDDAFHQMIEDTSLKLGREKAIDLLRKLVKLSPGNIDDELTSAVALYGNRRELINDYMNLAGDNAKQDKREEYKRKI